MSTIFNLHACMVNWSQFNSQTQHSPSCCYNPIEQNYQVLEPSRRLKCKWSMNHYSPFSCRLLQLSPNLQDTFPSFKGVALDELMNSRSLFLHSTRLMAVVEDAVSSLDDAQKFIDDLMKLGERHLAMSINEKHLKVR